MAALGVLLALVAAQRTARIAGVNAVYMWNLCVVALCAALAAQRLLLVAVNWRALRQHPAWLFGLGMIHHPLLAGAAVFAALGCALWYGYSHRMPLFATADALAPPLALGMVFEQVGALLAGSGYGTASAAAWAVTYTNPYAALWSGTPLDVRLHPVQAYAALAFLILAVFLFAWLPRRRQQGDVAGLWLLGVGAAIYVTEFWRDPEGRGVVLGGALDGPQIAAVFMVLAGALALRERERRGLPPLRQEEAARIGHGESVHE